MEPETNLKRRWVAQKKEQMVKELGIGFDNGFLDDEGNMICTVNNFKGNPENLIRYKDNRTTFYLEDYHIRVIFKLNQGEEQSHSINLFYLLLSIMFIVLGGYMIYSTDQP